MLVLVHMSRIVKQQFHCRRCTHPMHPSQSVLLGIQPERTTLGSMVCIRTVHVYTWGQTNQSLSRWGHMLDTGPTEISVHGRARPCSVRADLHGCHVFRTDMHGRARTCTYCTLCMYMTIYDAKYIKLYFISGILYLLGFPIFKEAVVSSESCRICAATNQLCVWYDQNTPPVHLASIGLPNI